MSAPVSAAEKPAAAPSIGDYEVGELLGEGSFGSVWECTLRDSGERRAIKIIEAVHAKRHGGLQVRRAESPPTSRRPASARAAVGLADACGLGHQAVMNEKAVLIHLDSPGHANIVRLHATFRRAPRSLAPQCLASRSGCAHFTACLRRVASRRSTLA